MSDRPELQRRLIGRVGEAAALTRAIGAARSGRPTTLLVAGPAGIGKTALVDHVLGEGLRDGLREHSADDPAPEVVRVSGVSWESAVPLGLARQLLRTDDATPALPDPASPQAVLEAGRRLHRQWTARQDEQPLVVVVEDAHWADAQSLRATASALRGMTDQRVLVLLVAREDPYELQGHEAEAPPAALETLEFLDGFRDDAVRPRPLTSEQVRTFAREVRGVALELPAASHLARHTHGNPRHIGRLLAELPARTWHERRPQLPAPARYTAVVRHRLAQCDPAARGLVEACSVLGEEALLDEAAALADTEDPLPAVDAARTAGLLTADLDPGRALLAFPHPLVRAAVLTGIDLARRTALHRRAADLIEDHGRRLAHRVAAATTVDPALAGELDRYAAERASAGEWAAVADTLVMAGRLSTDRAVREDRLLRGVDAMISAGDVPQATLFAAELESFPAGVLRDVVLGYLALMRGRPREAELFLTRAWEHCDPERQPGLTARICQRRVLHSLARWDAPALVAWAQRAVELGDPEDPSTVESEAVMGLGLAAMGRPEEAVAAYDAAAAKLPTGAQPQRFQLGRGWVDLALDAPETARRRLENAVPTGYRRGSTRISLWAEGWLARTQFALGAWPDALETVHRAAARWSEVRIELVRSLIHWTGAQIHALRGDWEAADEHTQAAAADLHHYEVVLVPACLARAQVAEARGDYAQVIEALAPVVQLTNRESVDEPGFWPWPDLYANALVVTGDLDEADTFLTRHEERAAARRHRSATARLGYARGRLTAARGDIDTARDQFDGALAQLEGLPLPYDRARVSFAYGQTLRRAGKRREADGVLKNARDLYRALGARTYVERCDRELKAGGLHTARSAQGLAQLTPQEQAVARLVASGATNGRTASELYISVKTVQYHLTHVYSKLGVRSRSELAARFRDLPDT